MKAEEKFKFPDISGDLLTENLEREVKNLKLKVRALYLGRPRQVADPALPQISTRMASLSNEWHSAKVVRTREKLSFFFGVMSVLFSALMFGMAPQYVLDI